ncbi:MAG: APC family permease, partial [Candidatus Omnitrophica bacterium]|nr:APC family permease [Candidatus Omnitrophota bacterium]
MTPKISIGRRIKDLILGKPRDHQDSKIFHKLTLVAFFAWVGLGADGLSSSCYGPQEAFLTLGIHSYLSIFVALGTVLTIFIITASYSQIVELFPAGGGGYLVASKLLSPTLGMVSGCALLIDYVLTITVSIASGADAIFSFLPAQWYPYKVSFAIIVMMGLMLLNMRGVKETVLPLVPIFLVFLITHVFIIGRAVLQHLPSIPQVAASTRIDIGNTIAQTGFWGMIFLVLRAYSMGAGTFTGIEAVSNGISVLREPKIETAKRTMNYMAVSLSFIVLGLMFAYLFYGAKFQPGKTLNAVLFEQATSSWGGFGYAFVLIALISEAMLLFVAAQTGFIGGPGVLANMASDRWFPTRFSTLSDRLVTQNGVLIMSGLALILMIISQGSVKLLVVLYSINVFITFVFSQLGMVRHWWASRLKVKNWYRKLAVNGVGLLLTGSVLIMMLIFKFFDGGWITLLITGLLIILAFTVRRHYYNTAKLLHRLNSLVIASESSEPAVRGPIAKLELDQGAKTAVLLVNGFNGIGLH